MRSQSELRSSSRASLSLFFPTIHPCSRLHPGIPLLITDIYRPIINNWFQQTPVRRLTFGYSFGPLSSQALGFSVSDSSQSGFVSFFQFRQFTDFVRTKSQAGTLALLPFSVRGDTLTCFVHTSTVFLNTHPQLPTPSFCLL